MIGCAEASVVAAGVTVKTGVAITTVTMALPVALLYVDELAPSGLYDAVSFVLPPARLPGRTVTVAVPPLSAVAPDE